MKVGIYDLTPGDRTIGAGLFIKNIECFYRQKFVCRTPPTPLARYLSNFVGWLGMTCSCA